MCIALSSINNNGVRVILEVSETEHDIIIPYSKIPVLWSVTVFGNWTQEDYKQTKYWSFGAAFQEYCDECARQGVKDNLEHRHKAGACR